MKKLKYILPALLLMLTVAACNNDLNKVFTGTLVEFNDAVLRTNATGKLYSITSLANTTAVVGTSVAQLNLVGPQRASELTVKVQVDAANTTASATSYTLSNGGAVVFAPNSSTAAVTLTTVKASTPTAPVVNLVLVIDSTSSDFKASQNYKRLGFSFRQ